MSLLNRTVVGSGIILGILSLTSPVLAGSSVSNTHTVRHSRGHGQTTIDVRKVLNGVQNNVSTTVKLDAVGENAGVIMNYNGSHFYGSGFANNIQNPDPFVMGGTTTQREVVKFNEVTNVNSIERFNFIETSTDYTLTTDAF